jgi:hypothetical protein
MCKTLVKHLAYHKYLINSSLVNGAVNKRRITQVYSRSTFLPLAYQMTRQADSKALLKICAGLYSDETQAQGANVFLFKNVCSAGWFNDQRIDINLHIGEKIIDSQSWR